MQYIPFLDPSMKVSKICLGTMTFGDSCDAFASREIVNAALEAGINFFDTAPMYSNGASEEHLGQALVGRRDTAVIATKVHAGLDEAAILPSLEASLRRLRTDHVDLFLVHWPAIGMNLAEMMGALGKAVGSGKARYIGCCNFPAWLLASSNAVAAEHGWPKLRCHQVPYNLVERGVEVEILPQATTEGIFVTAYRPLAVGLLTGGFRPGRPLAAGRRGSTDSRVITWLSQHGASIERFLAFSESRGLEPAQAALAWVSASPAVSCPIAGASSPQHVQEAARSVDIALDEASYRELTALFDTEPWEEGLQRFPGLKYNFPKLRRTLFLRSGSRKASDV
jgi:aryl-alcohol dehydrogenase-like predicted oxidoreductase